MPPSAGLRSPTVHIDQHVFRAEKRALGTATYEGVRISWWDQDVYDIVNLHILCEACHSHDSPGHLLTIV